MPALSIKDLDLDLTPAQQQAYKLAEDEGVVHLNELGETITVQHVFQLVMRLKQICNFDPLTGESSKLEQLVTDLEEVAESGRKALVFSQWVEPLKIIAEAVEKFGPLQYHGRIPQAERTPILDRFKNDPDSHELRTSIRLFRWTFPPFLHLIEVAFPFPTRCCHARKRPQGRESLPDRKSVV